MENDIFRIIKNTFAEASRNHKFGSYHISLYLFLVELCNNLYWPSQFGVPTDKAMHVLSLGSYNTYKKYLLDLEHFGAIRIVEFSKNQYTSLVIELNTCFGSALSKNDKAGDKHVTKQVEYNKTIKTIKTNKNYIYLDSYFFMFQEFYFLKNNTIYIDSDDERKKLASLTEKLDQFRKSTKDSRELIIFFEDFLKNIWALNNPFFSKNFSISVLDNKFNEIISQLKNSKNKFSIEEREVYRKPNYWQPNIGYSN
ncbi:hypothetical protein [Sphingobacterium composti Ten et al. 2007 non Yoo et al. 2007]|uniref:hypothetical protein n=1 Tax=Sphingobacterium composti TaxID=363260 RepID=UPI001359A592|nr:hypothetical protein [Sphingobacterium composti Ten et al. 2007 non Yoo et al. 2007]